MQEQLNVPSSLLQLALGGQLWGDAVGSALVRLHSSTSVQKIPSPHQPAVEHVHSYPGVETAPIRLVHVARALQPCVPSEHSSTSVQLTPSPA